LESVKGGVWLPVIVMYKMGQELAMKVEKDFLVNLVIGGEAV
jgi:hypothetical protein